MANYGSHNHPPNFGKKVDGCLRCDELTAGADLVYFGYDRNLRYFTLGHGGYFSPQQYTALNIPVDYRGRVGDVSYRLGATVGYASYREDRAALFPNNPGLQAEAEARAAATTGTPSPVSAFYAGQSQSGFVGGVRAEVDWAISPTLTLGGAVRYDKAANFDETRVLMRLPSIDRHSSGATFAAIRAREARAVHSNRPLKSCGSFQSVRKPLGSLRLITWYGDASLPLVEAPHAGHISASSSGLSMRA